MIMIKQLQPVPSDFLISVMTSSVFTVNDDFEVQLAKRSLKSCQKEHDSVKEAEEKGKS